MAKASGLGQFILVGGYDFSGDIGAVTVSGGPGLLDVTGIDKSAFERIGGVLDGRLEVTAFLNDTAGQAHPRLSPLTTSDVHLYYGTTSTIDTAAAGIIAKQLDYAGTRGQDGSLTFAAPHPANGYSLEWLRQLTAGKRTDTGATSGTTVNHGGASTTGWAAYLQVTAFSGTDVTFTIEDSANGSVWASVTGGAFTGVTSGPTAERIAGAAGATLRQYVRVTTSTTGGVTSVTFTCGITRHPLGAIA